MQPADAPDGAQAWRVVASSRTLRDVPVAVTGLLVALAVPSPEPDRPVVVWTHGTTGLGDDCAPSPAAEPWRAAPWIDELLASGYVVVVPDYEGLGGPGVHPYLVGKSEGRSVLDTVRAARVLRPDASADVVIAGHSQDGHAARFAGSHPAPR